MTLRVGVVICVASIVVVLSHPSIARPADQNKNKPNAADTGSLSSEPKCNTPADLIIGTVDQDLRACP